MANETSVLVEAFSREAATRWLQARFSSFARVGQGHGTLDVRGREVFARAGVRSAERLGRVTLARAADDPTPVDLPVFLVWTERLGTGAQRKTQFACAKALLKGWGQGTGASDVPGALFFFHAAEDGRTRLSLVTPRSQGSGDYKRQSFLLVPDASKNRTFRKYFPDGGARVGVFGRPGEKARGGQSLLARFSVEALTKEFYAALYEWYEWAAGPAAGVRFPDAQGDVAKTKEHLIRLITRLMFVWFVRERGLVPEALFDERALGGLLRGFDPRSAADGTYYNAILQNLFFATLNQPAADRAFADDTPFRGKSATYGVNTLFRDRAANTGGGHCFLVRAAA